MMLTQKSIMLKNQFANKNNSGHGKTPSAFVTAYMARNDATLTDYPVTDVNNEHSQNLTTENNVFQKQQKLLLKRKAHYSRRRVTAKSWSNLTTLEGRSFNQNSISLSKKGIDTVADQLQTAFDQGHTVLEMVASFDNSYLNDLGIEKITKPRDFHRDVDEMKLRLAVQAGCKSLAKDLGYLQPVFAGAIQLDRDHPHAHIAMAETSNLTSAKKFYDGSEYGQLTEHNRLAFMQTVDAQLTNMQALNFLPSNQTEQAQIATENYAQNYQLLPQKKQIILYQAASEDNALAPVLLKELALRPFSNYSVEQKTRILQTQKEDSDKQIPLPNIYNLNLQSNRQLMGMQDPLAQMVLKQRKIKAYREKMELKQKRLLKQLLYFRHRIRNNPQDKEIIEAQMLPYYQQAITNTAIKLDYTALFNYKPVTDPPKAVQEQAEHLANFQKLAKTPLAKASFKDQAIKDVVAWQIGQYTDDQSVLIILNSREDDLKLPYLKPNPVGNKRPTDQEFQKTKTMNDYEDLLAQNALMGLKSLSSDQTTKQAQADLNLQVAAANLVEPEKETIPKTETITPIKSVSYKQAEDLLIDLT